jgi:hypothetical protein
MVSINPSLIILAFMLKEKESKHMFLCLLVIIMGILMTIDALYPISSSCTPHFAPITSYVTSINGQISRYVTIPIFL